MAKNEKEKIKISKSNWLWIIPHRNFYYFITFLFIINNGYVVFGEGNVGCHYVSSLCLERLEFCFDDLAFGKCLPKIGIETDDIDRIPLNEEQSAILATMLEEMQGAGLGWDHPFVQCRVQGTLFSMRRNTPLPPNLCANLAPDPEILGPQSALAFVRFIPPNDAYADEVYVPPLKKELLDGNLIHDSSVLLPEQRRQMENLELLSEFAHQPDILEEEREQIIAKSIANQELKNRMKDMKNRIELHKMLAEYERGELKPPIYMNNAIYPPNEDFDLLTDNIEALKRTGQLIYREKEFKTEQVNDEKPKTFFREIAFNEHIPIQQFDSPEYFNHYKKDPISILIPQADEEPLDFSDNNYPPSKYQREQSRVYTEGGLVYVPDGKNNQNRKENARNFLANMLGFTRHERLDVKKPGPVIAPLASVKPDDVKQNDSEIHRKPENKEILPTDIKGDSVQKKKKVLTNHSGEDHGPFSVDPSYAFVRLKNPVDSWDYGVNIVKNLESILHINFTHIRVDRHEVSFRVEPNTEKKTAVDVANAINGERIKTNLQRRLGITVILAGVGDKVKQDPGSVMSRIELAEEGPDVTHIMAYMFAGAAAAAVIVIIVTLFLIRRHDKKRDKLGGLSQGISGNESSSKDYQELCRARMAGGKGTHPQDSPAGGRITSLSKENDRPPSSRSSTSSWSEEPALTNMDISTGHMVLSYMEDHLRNKGRLQREWEALCRYEAEPSAREAALQSQCSPLNRPGAPLPFDHSRVVLNHLANAEGLDYINASTITDHDPRAPAYVAAQGPLPSTLAHFWQMIWEQGAVVIVALCKLQENGEIACARYWPEEGAETYHIYEVHLVSEHIWCDDYLVRSFYLKNLRTSETRTVTQFHLLSWPQGGVPTQAKPLLEFRRKVNKSYRGRSCPIVVHGSAGAGRTGAYILLDLVLGRMNKGAREIDIAATLEHLRDQRAGLVATRQQFEFVLMAVAEEVHAILKALPANTTEKRELEKEPVKEEDEKPTPTKEKKDGSDKEKLIPKKDEK